MTTFDQDQEDFEDQVVEYYGFDSLDRACEIYYNPVSLAGYLRNIHGNRARVRCESRFAAEVMDYIDFMVWSISDQEPDDLLGNLFD